jgi:hypothetical protein
VCEVGPQARPWLNRAWARPASHTVDVVTVTLPVATVTMAGAMTRVLVATTLAAEEARVLVAGATVRAEEAAVQVSGSTVRVS